MAVQVQVRRGTATEHTSFTGATGEVTYDSTDKRLVVHDGITAGGIPLAKESEASVPQALGTGDSPQFAGVNVGHASDTTITRTAAGTIAVEGNTIYRAGGTDVPLADGGTGASLTDPNADRIMFWDDSAGAVTWLAPSAPLAVSTTNLTVATATTSATGVSELATDAEAQAKTDTVRSLTPSNLAALGATTTFAGLSELATDAETITGTDTVRSITPSNLTGASIYGNMPQNSQSAAYTLVAADQSKHIFHPSADTTARIWTIPANATVAFPIGTTITFINQNGAGTITIAITTDTMRLAGAGTTGSRTLAANGVATAIKVTSTEWIISGTGLT